jgi:hypothetical protein
MKYDLIIRNYEGLKAKKIFVIDLRLSFFK